ncbi:TLC domain-containing protein 2-like [Amphiura filiformis]|uniref:TLC domain-containing protein 2-like n=1 Tax=Amphiura filiformis TaxID=82378 RepID=UPI003B20BE3C
MLSLPVTTTLLSSCVVFELFKQFLDTSFIPAPHKYASEKRHKWKNILGSFIHASYCAVTGICCLILTPEYLSDRVNTFEQNGALMSAASMGYFLHDTLDSLRNQNVAQSWPILLHHVFIFSVGVKFLWRQSLLGYGLISTLVEVNGVFLHLRQLLLMYGVPKQSKLYKINLFLNIITYLGLRVGVLVVMEICLIYDRQLMPLWVNNLMLVATLVIIVINLVLLHRIIKVDVISENSDFKLNTRKHVMDW